MLPVGEHVDLGPIRSWPKPCQRPHPPIFVGGGGKGVLRRVLAYGDEWMPEGRTRAEALPCRIGELQDAARSAGRAAPVPVTVSGAAPDPETLTRLREIGVGRVILKAPAGDTETMERFLDGVTSLVAAVAA